MASPDLDWDHSVGENLLIQTDDDDVAILGLDDEQSGVSFYNGSLLNDSRLEDQDHIKISRRHLSFLLRSLDEASSLLREQRNLQDATRIRRDGSAFTRNRDTAELNRREQTKVCLKKLLHYVAKYNLIITIILQALMLALLTIIDMTVGTRCGNCTSGGFVDEEHKVDPATCIVMILINTINISIVIFISARVYKTFMQSRLTAIMIAQAYLSTVIMFAALYVITYRINRKGWTLSGFRADKDNEYIVVSYLYLKMLYHSISTSTLCGASQIYPDMWYNFLLMAIQMLLSFLYFTSILTVARSPSTPPAPKPTIHTNGSIPQVPSVLRLRRHSLNSLMSRQSLSERTIHMNGDVGSSEPNRYGGL